jgi:hypothetical protein
LRIKIPNSNSLSFIFLLQLNILIFFSLQVRRRKQLQTAAASVPNILVQGTAPLQRSETPLQTCFEICFVTINRSGAASWREDCALFPAAARAGGGSWSTGAFAGLLSFFDLLFGFFYLWELSTPLHMGLWELNTPLHMGLWVLNTHVHMG